MSKTKLVYIESINYTTVFTQSINNYSAYLPIGTHVFVGDREYNIIDYILDTNINALLDNEFIIKVIIQPTSKSSVTYIDRV